MGVDGAEVRYIARLARLALDDEELDVLAEELTTILEHFQSLSEVDTEGVPPAVSRLPRQGGERADVAAGSLSTEEALSGAPERDGPYYRVPGFLPEE